MLSRLAVVSPCLIKYNWTFDILKSEEADLGNSSRLRGSDALMIWRSDRNTAFTRFRNDKNSGAHQTSSLASIRQPYTDHPMRSSNTKCRYRNTTVRVVAGNLHLWFPFRVIFLSSQLNFSYFEVYAWKMRLALITSTREIFRTHLS